MLLDARCVLPQAGNILEQYHSIADLIYDGNDLGFVLDEQGQGMPNFMEKFLGALKYEGCDTLRFALDISQNLHCYEWGSSERLEEMAIDELLQNGIPDEATQVRLDLIRAEKEIPDGCADDPDEQTYPEEQLPINAAGMETLDNIWGLFETTARLDSADERGILYGTAMELAECQNLSDWIIQTDNADG